MENKEIIILRRVVPCKLRVAFVEIMRRSRKSARFARYSPLVRSALSLFSALKTSKFLNA